MATTTPGVGPNARAVHPPAVLLLVVMALGACGGGDGGGADPPGAARTVEAERLSPEADLYGTTGPLPDAPSGTLLRYQSMPTGIPGARAWRIVYLSRPVANERQAVSGMVLTPDPPLAGARPVVAWAHPTDGIGDRCAPSRDGPDRIIGAAALVAAGFVVAATDYEGLGTPGPHPYLDGVSAGRTVIDAARAASGVPGARTAEQTLFWGYSQGGQAALFAGQQAADYAPELDVLGTVAAAPAANLDRLMGGASGRPPLPGVALMMIGSWSLDLDLDPTSVLAAEAAAHVPRLEQVCEPNRLIAELSRPLVFDPPAAEVSPWRDLIARSTPGGSPSSGPVLLVQGGRDRLLDPASTEALFGRMCHVGSTVELRRFPRRGHGVALYASDQITRWLENRSEGLAARDGCP